MELTRVRSKSTNAEFTTRVVSDNMEVLDEPATDSMGKPLPSTPGQSKKTSRRTTSQRSSRSGDTSERNEDSA